ncbi:MAG: T9SS type A sorting domain-containing protein [Flavobacteriales bacterium]|nr:T9SS type A sorting domain-containing protein [Flavobacteriales bacterium]
MYKLLYRSFTQFLLAVVPVLFLCSNVLAQAHLRLMSYNLLNFPTSNITTRIDTLEKIVDYYKPHLFLIQELENESGLLSITDMMNTLGYGNFASGTFVPQQSNDGGGDNPLQHAIVYDMNSLVLVNESVVLTEYRDINEFLLYLNDPELENGADTSFIYVYVTHLKSSQGTAEQAIRLSMVNSLIDHLETIPPGSNVIFAGDFNIYNNMEPAYEAIVDNNNPILLVDPFGDYGNWVYSGFPHKEILTQSTREDVIYNDGASGGIDDRFDFIILSQSLMEDESPLRYVEDSYKSLGNTGECLNLDITACAEANPIPLNILIALYYMSDHLPQVMELETVLPEPKQIEEANIEVEIEFTTGNLVSEKMEFIIRTKTSIHCFISISNTNGEIVYQNIHRSNSSIGIDCSTFANGMYVLNITSEDGVQLSSRFGVVR